MSRVIGDDPTAVEVVNPRTSSLQKLPLATITAVLAIFVLLVGVWYIGAIYYNTGYLALNYTDIGQAHVWAHMTLLQRWGAALNSQSPMLPAPHQVVADLWSRLDESPNVPGNLWVDLVTTGAEAVLGFVVGAVVALVLAYIFVRSKILERSLFPYVVMSQTVPIMALVPAMVVVLGIGLRSKVVVAAYLAFYPITISAVKGLRSVDPLSEELMRSYAASTWQTLLKLKLPASLPYVFTGLKIGVTASLIGAIVSELPVGSQFGLGVSILSASSNGLNTALWATIIASGLLGLLLYTIVTLAERFVVRGRLSKGIA